MLLVLTLGFEFQKIISSSRLFCNSYDMRFLSSCAFLDVCVCVCVMQMHMSVQVHMLDHVYKGQRKMQGLFFISHWIWHWAGSQKTSVILLFLLPIVLGSQAHMVIWDSLLGCRDPDSADVLSAWSSPLWWGSLPHIEWPGYPLFLSVIGLTCIQDAMHACLVLLLVFDFYWEQAGQGTVLLHLFAVAFSG